MFAYLQCTPHCSWGPAPAYTLHLHYQKYFGSRGKNSYRGYVTPVTPVVQYGFAEIKKFETQ